MANYALLIYDYPPEEGEFAFPLTIAEDDAFVDAVAASGGTVLAHFPLTTPAISTGVRGPQLIDGLLAEASVVIAGIIVLAAQDLDVAIAVARSHPASDRAGVEIRPLDDLRRVDVVTRSG